MVVKLLVKLIVLKPVVYVLVHAQPILVVREHRVLTVWHLVCASTADLMQIVKIMATHGVEMVVKYHARLSAIQELVFARMLVMATTEQTPTSLVQRMLLIVL